MRGIYGDPEAAARLLDAIGGQPCPASPVDPALAPRAAYRGRCDNGAHAGQRIRSSGKWISAEHCGGRDCDRGGGRACACKCRSCQHAPSEGCAREVSAELPNRLRFCDLCLAAYRALQPREPREHPPALDRVEHMAGLCVHGQRTARGECGSCR